MAFCWSDDARHALQNGHDLRLGDDPVQQPVGDMLRRNPQRRAVLHQADIVDVRHLGTADALVDPAHDIAEQALRVVFELLLHLFGLEVRAAERDGQQVGQFGGLRDSRSACWRSATFTS